ncbi:hypothetical protein DENSPDRAFT_855452 [Dentipellis sp. KUC8613]|nr:hypothetical protein DENSPDRAFT_855452 [Dentipellis sp. KUC8613]
MPRTQPRAMTVLDGRRRVTDFFARSLGVVKETVQQRAKGRCSRVEQGEKQRTTKPEEDEMITCWIEGCTDRALPPTNDKVVAMANRILSLRGQPHVAPPPFVVFKGEQFQVSWGENNPGGALMGHSPTGYMDSELALDWLKWIEELTREKADGDTSGMLEIVDEMWTEVFTETNNKKAFEMTGLTRPVQQNTIPHRAVAPAEETSIQSAYPMPQSEEVRETAAVLDVLRKLHQPPAGPSAAFRTPSLDNTGPDSETLLSPASRLINPSLFTPRSRTKALAYHLQHSVTFHLPTGETVATDFPPEPPVIEHPPIILAPDFDSRQRDTLTNVDEMFVDDLRGELMERRVVMRQGHTTLSGLESTVHAQNAQMVIQHEYAVGIQGRLHDKEMKSTKSHTQKY